ncbi:16S rRNA (cytosine(1402)-N(4))-methyltransferase [Alkaliphilus crotonatoxidans]
MNFKHVSVLLEESIEYLNIKPQGTYVDGTLGGGGHSLEIAKRLNEKGLLIGIDQDENALKAAGERLKDYTDRFKAVRSNFSHLSDVLEQLEIAEIDGLLLDLGCFIPSIG